MAGRTYKLRCERCKEMLEEYHMEMMMGSKGYRSYPVHNGPCKRVKGKKAISDQRLAVGSRQKAGV